MTPKISTKNSWFLIYKYEKTRPSDEIKKKTFKKTKLRELIKFGEILNETIQIEINL